MNAYEMVVLFALEQLGAPFPVVGKMEKRDEN